MIGFGHSIAEAGESLSGQKAIIFPHIHKTAGTTIEYALRAEFGDRAIPCHTAPQRENITNLLAGGFFARDETYIIYGHRTEGVAELLGEAIPVTRFTFLRDPVKRAESLYSYMRVRRGLEQSPREFIDRLRPNIMARSVGASSACHALDLLKRDYFLVGLSETFGLHFALLCKLLRMSGRSFESRTVTRPEDKVTFEPDLVDHFVRQNQEDCALYSQVSTIMGAVAGDIAEYADGGVDLTMAEASYVKPTPLVFDLSRNNDHISLFLTGKHLWPTDPSKATAFFAKCVTVDPSMSCEIANFVHRSGAA